MRTVTLKLSEHLDCRLTALAKRQRTSRAQVLREALEAFIMHSPPLTFGELAADLITDDGPGDLSTNPKYMDKYGRLGADARITALRLESRLREVIPQFEGLVRLRIKGEPLRPLIRSKHLTEQRYARASVGFRRP